MNRFYGNFETIKIGRNIVFLAYMTFLAIS